MHQQCAVQEQLLHSCSVAGLQVAMVEGDAAAQRSRKRLTGGPVCGGVEQSPLRGVAHVAPAASVGQQVRRRLLCALPRAACMHACTLALLKSCPLWVHMRMRQALRPRMGHARTQAPTLLGSKTDT